MAFERSKKNLTTKINSDKNLVNNITPYEIKIAEKLEQLPVPDMADSIWASIEMQLNADLPHNTDDAPRRDAVKGKPGMGKGFYLSIITAIIIIAILFYKNKKQLKKNNGLPLPPKTEMVIPVTDSPQGPAGLSITDPTKNNIQLKNGINKKDSAPVPLIPGNRINFDSLTHISSFNTVDSSAAVLKNKAQVPSLDSSFINSPFKKPRGVKGISDSDYRISVEKDSVKRRG
jgi:hypothetical protein